MAFFEQELTWVPWVGNVAPDVVVPTMYTFELESSVIPAPKSPNEKFPFPTPVPPKIVENNNEPEPLAPVLTSVTKALPAVLS